MKPAAGGFLGRRLFKVRGAAIAPSLLCHSSSSEEEEEEEEEELYTVYKLLLYDNSSALAAIERSNVLCFKEREQARVVSTVENKSLVSWGTRKNIFQEEFRELPTTPGKAAVKQPRPCWLAHRRTTYFTWSSKHSWLA